MVAPATLFYFFFLFFWEQLLESRHVLLETEPNSLSWGSLCCAPAVLLYLSIYFSVETCFSSLPQLTSAVFIAWVLLDEGGECRGSCLKSDELKAGVPVRCFTALSCAALVCSVSVLSVFPFKKPSFGNKQNNRKKLQPILPLLFAFQLPPPACFAIIMIAIIISISPLFSSAPSGLVRGSHEIEVCGVVFFMGSGVVLLPPRCLQRPGGVSSSVCV